MDSNNGTTPAGTGVTGGTSGAAPVDFTKDSVSDNGLSMSDSLASAQDNLTSAGLAADTRNSTGIGLDQIGASDPSATMANPNDEPLVPAAPVPGSIGSVTSGPALAAVGAEMPPVATPASQDPAATPSLTSATPPQTTAYYNPFAPNTNASNAGASAETGTTTPANTVTPASAAMNTSMPASSTAVPTALKPKTSKFSNGERKMFSVPMVIALIVAVLMTAAAVTFFILWRGEADKQPVIVEKPVATQNDVVATVCDKESSDAIEGLTGLTSYTTSYANNYEGNKLTNAGVTQQFVFTDAAAAEAARAYFEEKLNKINETLIAEGEEAAQTSLFIHDNIVDYSVELEEDKLIGDLAKSVFELPVDENGVLMADVNDVKDGYEEQGYSCLMMIK